MQGVFDNLCCGFLICLELVLRVFGLVTRSHSLTSAPFQGAKPRPACPATRRRGQPAYSRCCIQSVGPPRYCFLAFFRLVVFFLVDRLAAFFLVAFFFFVAFFFVDRLAAFFVAFFLVAFFLVDRLAVFLVAVFLVAFFLVDRLAVFFLAVFFLAAFFFLAMSVAPCVGCPVQFSQSIFPWGALAGEASTIDPFSSKEDETADPSDQHHSCKTAGGHLRVPLIFPHWNSFPGLSSRRIPFLEEFFPFFFDFHLVTTEAKADISIARGVEARHTEAIYQDYETVCRSVTRSDAGAAATR